MTKFLNISTDNTLGGNSPSDETVSSQKALKTYIDAHSSGSPSWGSIVGTLSNQTDLNNALGDKQDTLVSGTNIKTINNNSILGSGNVDIDALPSQTGQSGKYLTTDGSSASWNDIPSDTTKANTSLSNLTSTGKNIANWSNNVTNCITEIPQDIKLELNNGTLTLKAGSKVYVPNGSGVFDEVVISSDLSRSTGDEGKLLVFYPNGGGFLDFILLNKCYSGTTSPGENWCIWYDTSSNYIYFYSTDSQNPDRYVSVPLAIITISNGVISSIDQVFNGFGYIGNTIYMLPGVKGLLANGFNEDGSLKNYTWTNSSVKIRNLTSSDKDHKYITTNFVASIISTIYDQISSDTQPTVPTTSFWYIPKDNLNACVLGDGTAIIPYNETAIGRISLDSTGRVLSLTPKTAFHAVDYNDFGNLSSQVATKANDSDVVKLTGNQTITGQKTIQNAQLYSKNTTADGTASSIATSPEYGLYIQDKNNSRIGNFFGGQLANGNIRTYMCACRPVNGTTIYKYAEIQQYPDGTAVFNINTNRAVAPTPDTSDNSTKIATTAFVKNQGYIGTANLATCHVVVETYVNGTSWYRVYDDGWVEQGGMTGTRSGDVSLTISLLKTMANTNYTICSTTIYSAAGADVANQITEKTTTNFKLYDWNQRASYWYVCGQGA